MLTYMHWLCFESAFLQPPVSFCIISVVCLTTSFLHTSVLTSAASNKPPAFTVKTLKHTSFLSSLTQYRCCLQSAYNIHNTLFL